jgi:protein-S-isoprenylcysteine O-methyltransferase Ste14
MFKRILIFTFGLASYALFLATFLYAIGFIGNFGVPRTLDQAPSGPLATALLVDLGLLALFAIQHSVMARPAFKRWLTRVVPESAERSLYVLASSLALIAMFLAWRPLGGVIWEVADSGARMAIWGAFAFGWLLVLVATFLINHFDLFGLRQVWLQLVGRRYTPLKFGTPGPYKLVRHPLYLGWFFAFWATPTMTLSHLLFAVMTTAYILIAIRLEERDLVDALGDDYRRYRERVPMVIPFLGRRGGARRMDLRT